MPVLGSIPMVLATAGAGDAVTTFDVSTVMQSAVSTTQSQLFSVLGVVVPAIVAVTAAVVCIKFGVGWLRKIKG